jgi:hypothetical protein
VYQRAVLKPSLARKLKDAIAASRPEWDAFVAATSAPVGEDDTYRLPLVMKYIPVERSSDYLPALPVTAGRPFGRRSTSWPAPHAPPVPPDPDPSVPPPPSPTKGIFIGNKDYTWGKAVYVTGIHQPLSTATYGRVGVVSYIQPANILRVFDARDQNKYEVYLEWLQCQQLYSRALLTVHTNHWLHGLRNAFRLENRIDVVMCSPDEQDEGLWYTDPQDVWLCVSDFEPVQHPTFPGQEQLKDNFSNVFPDVRLTVLIEEEFVLPNEKDPKLPLPRPPAWPNSRVRQLAVSRRPPRAPSKSAISRAYWHGDIVRVPS